jgi:O-antigen/teichoic acid export membrane protein
VLLVAGTTAVAREAILVVLTPDYLPAVPVLPIVAVAMALQGIYLLTSIGLNLTSRTEFYPIATMTAAVVGLGSGTMLMPAMGVTGAAIALLLASVTQTGVAYLFARRLYPIRYEWFRLARVVGAGLLAVVAALALPGMPPLVGLVARGATAAGVFVGLLWISGFLRATERAFLHEKWRRLKPLRG